MTKRKRPPTKVRRRRAFPHAEDHELKAELVREIARTMMEKALTQQAAARMLRIGQPDVSKMLRGHFRQFSAERLMRFLVRLGREIEIALRPVPHGTKITVTARDPV